MKRISLDRLMPGDIVLTAQRTATSKGIRAGTFGLVSHAMVCVQHGSVIDATDIGVHARNVQREFFEDRDRVLAFRPRTDLSPPQLALVVQYARSQVGMRYSKTEAIRTVAGIRRPRHRWQFCSRLVAQSYAYAGVPLVPDKDYCTPDDLRRCTLLRELGDVTETVDDAEFAFWRDRPDPVDATRSVQNDILAAVRELDGRVEDFSDLVQAVLDDPAIDAPVADILLRSGYLKLWRHDVATNAGHYDGDLLKNATNDATRGEIRDYCIAVVREFHSGGHHQASTLVTLDRANAAMPRRTTALLVRLYRTLVANDERRRAVAHDWLARHHPADLATHLERIEPHSPLWFQMVGHCEPQLAALARRAIDSAGTVEVCSSCGDDPASDYRIANGAAAMPGVPSLRLCDDCVAIRRGFGEVLVPMA